MLEILRKIILEFQSKDLSYIVKREQTFPVLKGKATVITGMRRAGKTSFCYQKMRDLIDSGTDRNQILYLNFEDDRLSGLQLKDCQNILDAYFSLYPDNRKKECWFFFDEVQNVDGWERFVRRLLDTTDIHIVLTGSSSKLLTAEISTAMRGRSINAEIMPFSFREYLQYHHVFDTIPEYLSDDDIAHLRHEMEKYFQLGGFPEVYGAPDLSTRVKILQEYNDLVMFKDVIERHKVTNTVALRHLLHALYQSNAQKFSVSGFAKTLSTGMQVKCSKVDLLKFMDYLEEAFIVFRTELHSRSEKAKMVNPNKVYMIDVGLVRAMDDDPEANKGWLLENLVFLHLHRTGFDVDYVITSDRKEVDFYAFNKVTREKLLIQVSWSLADDETRKREVTPLLKASQGMNIKKKLIVTWNEEDTLEEGIQVVPIWKYLIGRC